MKLDSRLASGLGLSHSTIRTVFDLSKSSDERLHIVKLLREIDAPQRVRFGSVLIKDPDPLVRCELARTLGSLGRVTVRGSNEKLACETVRYLSTLASDDDWRVRCDVALAVLGLGWKRTFPIIKNLLNDEVSEVRSAALKAYVGLRAFHPNAAAKLGMIQLQRFEIFPRQDFETEPTEPRFNDLATEDETLQLLDVGHDVVVGPYVRSASHVLADLFTATTGEIAIEDLGSSGQSPQAPEPPQAGHPSLLSKSDQLRTIRTFLSTCFSTPKITSFRNH